MTGFASDLRAALSPVVFAQEQLGFTPDPWQENVLNSVAQQVTLCCSRQAGKSTVAAILGTHMALYRPKSLTVLVSPSLRQSGELFRKVTTFLKMVENKPRIVEDNSTSLALENEARIVSLPGSEGSIRGYSSVSLAIFDEAAFAAEETYRAIRPMLAVSKGRLMLLSTPNGKRGFFYDAWESPDFEHVSVPATECPRIAPEFLESEKRAMGLHWFKQEYMCEFLEGVNSLLSYDAVQGAFSSEVQALDLKALLGGKQWA